MTNNNKTMNVANSSRRKLLQASPLALTAPIWVKPVVNAVILPAHAQTSLCQTDMTIITVGGNLNGNASGATSCQAACEAEAESLNSQLCEVREISTATGTDCECDIDMFQVNS